MTNVRKRKAELRGAAKQPNLMRDPTLKANLGIPVSGTYSRTRKQSNPATESRAQGQIKNLCATLCAKQISVRRPPHPTPLDQKTLEREAHKLAGGSIQIGASVVRLEAEAIEEACRRGDIEAAARRMPVLSREWLKVKEMLCQYLTLGSTDMETN